jgi:hypothetical protein
LLSCKTALASHGGRFEFKNWLRDGDSKPEPCRLRDRQYLGDHGAPRQLVTSRRRSSHAVIAANAST